MSPSHLFYFSLSPYFFLSSFLSLDLCLFLSPWPVQGHGQARPRPPLSPSLSLSHSQFLSLTLPLSCSLFLSIDSLSSPLPPLSIYMHIFYIILWPRAHVSSVLEFHGIFEDFRGVFSPYYWVFPLRGLSCILGNLCILFPRVVYYISVYFLLVFVCGRVPRTVHVLGL